MEEPKKKQMCQELHDFMLKYEAIEEKYKTSQLENNEYKKQVCYLEEQVHQQEAELASFDGLNSASNEIRKTLHSMDIDIEDKDEQICELTDECSQYIKIITELKSENQSLKEQNKKLVIALENHKLQKNAIHAQNHDDMALIMKENQILRDKINAMDRESQMMNALPINIDIPRYSSPATRIKFTYTPQTCTPDLAEHMNAFKGSLRDIEKMESMQIIPELSDPSEDANLFWQESLERIETYRNDLMHKLNMVPEEEIEEKHKEVEVSMEDILDSCLKKKKESGHKRMLSESLPKPFKTSPKAGKTGMAQWNLNFLQFNHYRY